MALGGDFFFGGDVFFGGYVFFGGDFFFGGNLFLGGNFFEGFEGGDFFLITLGFVSGTVLLRVEVEVEESSTASSSELLRNRFLPHLTIAAAETNRSTSPQT